jgi:hypothetical protein
MSPTKIGFVDIGLIVDVLIAERERTINLQQDAIRELSTPVLQLRDRLLADDWCHRFDAGKTINGWFAALDPR